MPKILGKDSLYGPIIFKRRIDPDDPTKQLMWGRTFPSTFANNLREGKYPGFGADDIAFTTDSKLGEFRICVFRGNPQDPVLDDLIRDVEEKFRSEESGKDKPQRLM